MMRARLLAVTAAAGLCTIVATPASAQTCTTDGSYPPVTTCTGAMSDTTIEAGEEVTVTIVTEPVFIPFESVTITVFSTPQHLATVQANSIGAVNTRVTLPANLAVGPHRIELVGLQSNERVIINFQVVGDATGGAGAGGGTGGGTGGLVNTGSNATLPLAATGIALIAFGAGAVVVARRTRTAPLAV